MCTKLSLPPKFKLYSCGSQRTVLHDPNTRAFAALGWGFQMGNQFADVMSVFHPFAVKRKDI